MLFRPDEFPPDVRNDPVKRADCLTGALFYIVHNWPERIAPPVELDWQDHQDNPRGMLSPRFLLLSDIWEEKAWNARN